MSGMIMDEEWSLIELQLISEAYGLPMSGTEEEIRKRISKYVNKHSRYFSSPKRINFIFVRHGYSCLNMLYDVYRKKFKNYSIKTRDFRRLLNQYSDPPLTVEGAEVSKLLGPKLISILNKTYGDMDVVGCSSMLRALETCIYMTSKRPVKVFPYLKEISIDSDHSEKMRSISEHIQFLEKEGVNESIDHSHVADERLRNAPGNINTFMNWFINNVSLPEKQTVNVLVFAHANIIYKEFGTYLQNNSGLVASTVLVNKTIKVSKVGILPKARHVYSSIKCSENRCKDLCSLIEFKKE